MTHRLLLPLTLLALAPLNAFAQANPDPSAFAAEDEVLKLDQLEVESTRARSLLDEPTRTGGRLGLTNGETPAMINIFTQEDLQAQGLRSAIEAYSAAPGVVAGNIPGEPGMATIRGFSSGGSVAYLFDGVRSADSSFISRNVDTFNYERIEILKGPASVIHGTGALAGAINLVPKKPILGVTSFDGLLSYGSFNSVRAGFGANLPLGRTVAARADLSYSRSDGYVDDTDSRTGALTTGLTFQPNSRLTFGLALDYYQDRFRTPYQAAPLLPATVARRASSVVSGPDGLVLDRSIRDLNYNVSDGLMKSDSFWARSRATYRLDDHWQLINELSFYDADRDWINSEDFSYNAGTGLLDRGTTKILHDHEFWSERAYLTFDGTLGAFRDRFAAGVEYNDTDFASVRRFGQTTSVDPFAPDRGFFPDDTAANFPGAGNRVSFDSSVVTKTVFLENALDLTPAWLVVAGLRYESLDLHRRIDDLNAGTTTRFGRDFEELSWRLGTVYKLNPTTQIYAQYNRAVTPVGSLLLSNLARANFDLTTGNSIEGGVRTSFWEDRAVLTAAAYRIEQNNILTRDPVTPSLTVQGGSRASKGIELDLSFAATSRWQIEANAGLLKSEFTRLLEGGTGANRAGNRPPNVPQRLFNLSTSYRLAALPLTLGVGLRHVGDFYTDNANNYRVSGRTLLNAWVAYRLPRGTLTLRGRNLTDKFYADWSGYSSTQVYVGAPLSVDLTWTGKF